MHLNVTYMNKLKCTYVCKYIHNTITSCIILLNFELSGMWVYLDEELSRPCVRLEVGVANPADNTHDENQRQH